METEIVQIELIYSMRIAVIWRDAYFSDRRDALSV